MSLSMDVYTNLDVRHNFAHSQRYLHSLQMLITPQQARLVGGLPAKDEELAQRLGLEAV